jgi:hypothetical protein
VGTGFLSGKIMLKYLPERPVHDHAAWFWSMAIPVRRAERASSNLSRLHGTMSVFSD